MEKLFFAEIIGWLISEKASIGYDGIELDGKLYYSGSKAEMNELFELFKQSID